MDSPTFPNRSVGFKMDDAASSATSHQTKDQNEPFTPRTGSSKSDSSSNTRVSKKVRRIRLRLALMLVIPFVSILILSGLLLPNTFSAERDSREALTADKVASVMSDLIPRTLQEARCAAVAILAHEGYDVIIPAVRADYSKPQNAAAALNTSRELLDGDVTELVELMDDLSVIWESRLTASAAGRLHDDLIYLLSNVRSKTDALVAVADRERRARNNASYNTSSGQYSVGLVGIDTVLAMYFDIVNDLLAMIGAIVQLANTPEVSYLFVAATASATLLRTSGSIGISATSALISGGFASDEAVERFVVLTGRFEAERGLLGHLARQEDSVVTALKARELENFLELSNKIRSELVVRTNGGGTRFLLSDDDIVYNSTTAAQLQSYSDYVITVLSDITRGFFSSAAEQIEREHATSLAWLVISIVVVVAAFVITLAMSFVFAKQISAPFFAQQQMKRALKAKVVAMAEHEDSLARFVPSGMLKLLRKPTFSAVTLGDHALLSLTIVFSDVWHFTSLSERFSPMETFQLVNAFYSKTADHYRHSGGMIDKYFGDGVLSLFLDIGGAVTVANALHDEAELLSSEHRIERRCGFPFRVGVGIHSGDVVLGTVGSEDRMDMSIISDAANMASRVEGFTRQYDAPTLMSEAAFTRLSADQHLARFVGSVFPKGKKAAVSLYEPISADTDVAELKRAELDLWNAAMDASSDGRYEEATRLMKDYLSRVPNDAVAIRKFEVISQKTSGEAGRSAADFDDRISVASKAPTTQPPPPVPQHKSSKPPGTVSPRQPQNATNPLPPAGLHARFSPDGPVLLGSGDKEPQTQSPTEQSAPAAFPSPMPGGMDSPQGRSPGLASPAKSAGAPSASPQPSGLTTPPLFTAQDPTAGQRNANVTAPGAYSPGMQPYGAQPSPPMQMQPAAGMDQSPSGLHEQLQQQLRQLQQQQLRMLMLEQQLPAPMEPDAMLGHLRDDPTRNVPPMRVAQVVHAAPLPSGN